MARSIEQITDTKKGGQEIPAAAAAWTDYTATSPCRVNSRAICGLVHRKSEVFTLDKSLQSLDGK